MLVFPTSFFRIAAQDVDFSLPSLSGGESLSGVDDRLFTTGGGRWFAKLPEINLARRDLIMTFRAFKSALNGGENPFIFPIVDARHQPFGTVGGVPFSDGSAFSDGSLFDDSGAVAEVTADAALRATSLTVDLSALPQALIGGERFTVVHSTWGARCYQVGQVGDTSLQFHPPLREAVPAGTFLDFDNPRFIARIAESSAPMTNPLFARASAVFLEDMGGTY